MFLNFYKRVFNQFENILPRNKDTEVVFVRKMCLIKLFLSTLVNLSLIFSWKYKWPEHYFSVCCLANSQKLLTTNQFLVSTILFANINIYSFNLRFDRFSIIVKKVNQIKNKVVCVEARLVFYCALTTGRCIAFQRIFIN